MSKLNVDGFGEIKTLEGFVTNKLREAIMSGDLKPGSRLDQNEISEMLNVSRSPVREALRTLAREGLVDMYPHRGAVVAKLSSKELEDVYFIRKILEGTAARLAADSLDNDRVEKLKRLIEQLDSADDLDEWLDLNRLFHSTIYEVLNRPRLISLIENLRNIAAPHIREFISIPEERQLAQVSHRRILQACIDRDGQRAQFEIEEHLRKVCEGATTR